MAGADHVQSLLRLACSLGVDGVAVVAPSALVVEERFVAYCKDGCASYGLAPGCPPHAPAPDRFRDSLKGYEHVIVFRVDAPFAALKGEGRVGTATRVHDVAATLELEAVALGYAGSRGIAAGSCRDLFCRDRSCGVLEGGSCPFSRRARPSLSALGVDVTRLCDLLGWKLSWNAEGDIGEDNSMGMMIGMVLVS